MGQGNLKNRNRRTGERVSLNAVKYYNIKLHSLPPGFFLLPEAESLCRASLPPLFPTVYQLPVYFVSPILL